MRKILLTALFAICAMAAYSQVHATTPQEYKYLVAGHFEANMPQHHLVTSSVHVTDGDINVAIWQLYRDGAGSSSALVIIYAKGKTVQAYICIPDVKSPASMWADYNKRLGALKNDGKALQVISYALGQFAAAE